MYSHSLKIPKERIPILIGKKGETKKYIEGQVKIKLAVDSKEGDVVISGEDSVNVFIASLVIRAIARGFNPVVALNLLGEEYSFELINVSDYAKTKNSLIRLKGRVIGGEGKSKKQLEQLTHTDIAVYGKTVGIIGLIENVMLAKQAVERLLQGSRHGNVYAWLEKQKKEVREEN